MHYQLFIHIKIVLNSTTFNINKFILIQEYDYKLKHWLEKINTLNILFNVKFNECVDNENTIKLDKSFKEEMDMRENNLRAFMSEHNIIIRTICEIISVNKIDGYEFRYVPNIALLFMEWHSRGFD